MRRALLLVSAWLVGCATPPPPVKAPPPFRTNALEASLRDKLAPKLRAQLDATGIPVTAPFVAYAQINGHTTSQQLDEAKAAGVSVDGVTVAAERDMWTASLPADQLPRFLALPFVIRLDETRWVSSPLMAAAELVRLDESVRPLLVNTTPAHALTIKLHLAAGLDDQARATLKALGTIEERTGAYRTMSCALPALAGLNNLTQIELLESTVRKSDSNDDWWRKLDGGLSKQLATTVKPLPVKVSGSATQALDAEMQSALQRLGAGQATPSGHQFTLTVPRTYLRCLAELPFVVSLSQ